MKNDQLEFKEKYIKVEDAQRKMGIKDRAKFMHAIMVKYLRVLKIGESTFILRTHFNKFKKSVDKYLMEDRINKEDE